MSTSKSHQRRQPMPRRLVDSPRFKSWPEKKTSRVPAVKIEFTDDDCLVVVGDTRVAKRGDNMEWIPLEPGFQILSPPDHEFLSITFDASRIQ